MDNYDNLKTPWQDSLDGLPLHLDYYKGTMYEGIKLMAETYPDYNAFYFMGRPTTYKNMFAGIQQCAKSLRTLGIRKGDKVTIALPNCPQAIYSFYAINAIGAIATMVHPLSAEKELEYYVNTSGSIAVITLDQFYNKFEAIRNNTELVNIIIASVKDELSKPIKAGYMLTSGRKIEKIPKDAPVILWKNFMRLGRSCSLNFEAKVDPDDTAVILFSGGTTGISKAVELSSYSFNAFGLQIIATNPMFRPGDRMLAALPIFHGFGLGVCIHSMLLNGGSCVLVPRFTAQSYAKMIVRYKCNFIAGVPTLYEAILRLHSMEKADLSSLKGVYCGGDTLSIELKKEFDKFLYDHNASIQIREGYGATESVAACCLTPPNIHKEGSIGIPFPDTYIKIVQLNTTQEVPYGEEGEIVITGPTIMKGYMNSNETDKTLKLHEDGHIWLHTGDLGTMDSEGFLFFKGRAKRMIISSGYNIYPAQMENVLNSSKMVDRSCVIGIPDSYKMQKIKVFIVLAKGYEPNEDSKLRLMAFCKKHFAKFSMPYDIEFRQDLPKTLVGKIAYRQLEEEEIARINALTSETAEE